jgi:hypothetical protein
MCKVKVLPTSSKEVRPPRRVVKEEQNWLKNERIPDTVTPNELYSNLK